MRKVKDAKDLSTNELIYFKGHAKATYMSDGTTVEDAINNIEVGTGADLSDYAKKEELNSKQDAITDLETIRQGAAKGATSVQQGTLSTVATSGSYNDLTNKPTIPNAVSESTVSGWGFTKNTGTVTGIKMNGASKGSSGVIDLGTVITEHQDITGKQDKLVSGTNIKTINGTSLLGSGDITLSGGEGGSGTVYWNDIQNKPIVETLLKEEDGSILSATRMNITVFGEVGGDSVRFSINGIDFYDNGDFDWEIHKNGDGTKFLADDGTYKEISGSGEGSASNGNAYQLVNHGTSDTTFALTPNTFHVWDLVDTLTLTIGEEITGVMNEYLFQVSFIGGCTLSLPASITWANDEIPEFDDLHIFQISIVNNCATYLKFKKS